jgi:predicted glycosyltransferase
VCIPYAGGLESEQTLRCSLLAEKGALETVEPGSVTANNVARAITRAMARPDRISAPVNMAGAENTALMLRQALTQNRNIEIGA